MVRLSFQAAKIHNFLMSVVSRRFFSLRVILSIIHACRVPGVPAFAGSQLINSYR